eukprot:m.131461 g.131461  ORF g.131461 m.131461 type:complete len:355 (-) comp29549_c0_seq2:203-1267(-)
MASAALGFELGGAFVGPVGAPIGAVLGFALEKVTIKAIHARDKKLDNGDNDIDIDHHQQHHNQSACATILKAIGLVCIPSLVILRPLSKLALVLNIFDVTTLHPRCQILLGIIHRDAVAEELHVWEELLAFGIPKWVKVQVAELWSFHLSTWVSVTSQAATKFTIECAIETTSFFKEFAVYMFHKAIATVPTDETTMKLLATIVATAKATEATAKAVEAERAIHSDNHDSHVSTPTSACTIVHANSSRSLCSMFGCSNELNMGYRHTCRKCYAQMCSDCVRYSDLAPTALERFWNHQRRSASKVMVSKVRQYVWVSLWATQHAGKHKICTLCFNNKHDKVCEVPSTTMGETGES